MAQFINRWLFSCSAKDIAVLYKAFAGFSGLIGSALSFMIRLELSGGGQVYFLGNNHDYNVMITAHGIFMIFFLVMPFLIGGLGRLFLIQSGFKKEGYKPIRARNYKSLRVRCFSTRVNNEGLHPHQGQYLAGLIEGDGSIIVPDPELKTRTSLIRICFASKDLPQAIKLKDLIGFGKIVYPKVGNYVLQEITTYEGLYHVVNLVNPYFRTPKQEAQHRLINFLNIRALGYLNKKTSTESAAFTPLVKKGLDLSPVNSGYWLAGMIDADGNFNVIICLRKNTNNTRIQTQKNLELRQTYHRDNLGFQTPSYLDIKSRIGKFLTTNVQSRSRKLNTTECHSFKIKACSVKAQDLLISYFDSYPLLSGKHKDYLDWKKITYLQRSQNNCDKSKSEVITKCNFIKSGMNSKRIIYTWDHLNSNFQLQKRS